MLFMHLEGSVVVNDLSACPCNYSRSLWKTKLNMVTKAVRNVNT